MVEGTPDYTQDVRIQGKDVTDALRTVFVDATGRIVTVMTGSYGGTPTDVAVDSAGRLVAVLQDPVSGYNVGIDAAGRLTAVMKGALGATLYTVAVDDGGRIITLLRDPASGNYAAIDASGYLTTVMKAVDGVTLRSLAVDSGGRILTVLRDPTSNNYLAVDASGYMASVIKGLDGSTLRTLAVDAAGNMIAAIKGTYGSVLKTVATDVNGQLVMVLVDSVNPWGERPVVGSGELAARLGSPMNFERRGSVIYMNNGGQGLSRGYIAVMGTAAAGIVSSAYALESGYSYKLTSGSSAGAGAMWLDRAVLSAYGGKIGFEIKTTLPASRTKIHIIISVADGTNIQIYGFLWSTFSQKLYYWGAGNDWVDSGHSVTPGGQDGTFWPLKLVVDLDTHKYLRMFIGNTADNWSAFSGYYAASVASPCTQISVACLENGDGVSRSIYFTDIIVTVGEDAN